MTLRIDFASAVPSWIGIDEAAALLADLREGAARSMAREDGSGCVEGLSITAQTSGVVFPRRVTTIRRTIWSLGTGRRSPHDPPDRCLGVGLPRGGADFGYPTPEQDRPRDLVARNGKARHRLRQRRRRSSEQRRGQGAQRRQDALVALRKHMHGHVIGAGSEVLTQLSRDRRH